MISLAQLQAALALPAFDGVTAQMRMAPAGRADMRPRADHPPRQSAVLVLIYPEADGSLHLLLTKRADHLRGHSGQVSFPGGSRDLQDVSYQATALRETCEELGICDEAQITLIGHLTPLWIPPSNFDVYPIVALMNAPPQMTPNPHEVAAVFSLSLDDLCSDRLKQTTTMTFRGQAAAVPYYAVGGHVVWGATCMILSELEQRLQAVQAPPGDAAD